VIGKEEKILESVKRTENTVVKELTKRKRYEIVTLKYTVKKSDLRV